MRAVLAVFLTFVMAAQCVRRDNILNIPPNLREVYPEKDLAVFLPPEQKIELGEFPVPVYSKPVALPLVDVSQT